MGDPSNGLEFISGSELRRLVPMADAIAAVRDAFRLVSEGGMESIQRGSLPDGSLLTMAAHGAGSPGTSVKVIGIRQDRALADRPLVNAVVLWFDHASGAPVAVIEGAELTALRTGAASGVATDLLAAPGAAVLAMIGSGAQAFDQVLAVCTVRPIREVRIFSRNPISAAALRERIAHVLPQVAVATCPDLPMATREADVVCAATTATSPLIHRADLRARVHINAVGAYRPEMCEVSTEVIEAASPVAVDQVEAARQEAGDLLQAAATGRFSMASVVELGHLLGGPPPEPSGWTLFKSVGVGAQDWAIAGLAVERAAAGQAARISRR